MPRCIDNDFILETNGSLAPSRLQESGSGSSFRTTSSSLLASESGGGLTQKCPLCGRNLERLHVNSVHDMVMCTDVEVCDSVIVVLHLDRELTLNP